MRKRREPSRNRSSASHSGRPLPAVLDELVLWLASHAADLAFVNREGQKLAKLVEAQFAGRPIPLISFVARQRDMRDLDWLGWAACCRLRGCAAQGLMMIFGVDSPSANSPCFSQKTA